MNTERMTIQPVTVAEKLIYCTIRICGDTSTGTGFFFNFKISETEHIELLLTNKHVINGNKELKLYFHEGKLINGKIEPTNKSFTFEITDFLKIWTPHHDDSVDMGALSFGSIRSYVKEKLNKEIFSTSLDESLIKADNVLQVEADVAEEILMIGYPIGLFDDTNNFPIVRKGIVATHPALNFQDKNIGVVDIACFPGSSGLPVLIYTSGMRYDKSNNLFIMGDDKVILLGLLYAGPSHTSEGKIEIKAIPTHQTQIAKIDQMIHLGYYVKAKEILLLCEQIKAGLPKK